MIRNYIKLLTILTLAFFLNLSFGTNIVLAEETVELKAGTNVRLRLDNTINSEDVNVGQNIQFSVSSEVKVDDKVVIESGAPAMGKVVDAEDKGMLGKPGKLGIQLTSVKAVDGQDVMINASKVVKGKSKQTTALVVTLILCIFGLFIKGKDASLQAGSVIDARITSDYQIEIG